MFPYEKQNLVNYRILFGWTAALFVVCVVIGVLMHKYVGLAFAATLGCAALGAARELFSWYPEPTAKRQFATAIGVTVALGVAGYVLVDWAIEAVVTVAAL